MEDQNKMIGTVTDYLFGLDPDSEENLGFMLEDMTVDDLFCMLLDIAINGFVFLSKKYNIEVNMFDMDDTDNEMIKLLNKYLLKTGHTIKIKDFEIEQDMLYTYHFKFFYQITKKPNNYLLHKKDWVIDNYRIIANDNYPQKNYLKEYEACLVGKKLFVISFDFVSDDIKPQKIINDSYYKNI